VGEVSPAAEVAAEVAAAEVAAASDRKRRLGLLPCGSWGYLASASGDGHGTVARGALVAFQPKRRRGLFSGRTVAVIGNE